jgi:hypothetical protein
MMSFISSLLVERAAAIAAAALPLNEAETVFLQVMVNERMGRRDGRPT